MKMFFFKSTRDASYNLAKEVGLVMSESWQLFFYANLMVFPSSSIA